MCNRIEVGDIVECTTGELHDVSVGQMFTVLERVVTQDDDILKLATCPTPLTTSRDVGACGTFQTKYFRLKYHAQNKAVKVDDIVVCVDGVGIEDVKVGDVRKVIGISKINNNIQLEGVMGFYKIARFKLQDPVYTPVESSEPEVIKTVEVVDHRSTHNFKVGDSVRCINKADTACLKKGSIYTIEKVLVGGALILDLNNSQYNHSLFEHVENKPVEVGDVVECVNNSTESGCMGKLLIVGGIYVVSRVLNKQGSHIEVEGIKGEPFGMVRFKLHKSKEVVRNNTKNENKVEDYSLVIKGAVVECVDDVMSDNKLKEGSTYVVSRVIGRGRHIALEGIEDETYTMKRFKLVMTNRKFKPTPKVTVRQLEAFRKMVTFNQIIVEEGIYFDEDKQDWACVERSDWWLNYIRGAWVTFLEFEKMALNKSISDWVEGK